MKINMSEPVCVALQAARLMFGVLLESSVDTTPSFLMMPVVITQIAGAENARRRTFNVKCKILTKSDARYPKATATISVELFNGTWCVTPTHARNKASLGPRFQSMNFLWDSRVDNYFFRPDIISKS